MAMSDLNFMKRRKEGSHSVYMEDDNSLNQRTHHAVHHCSITLLSYDMLW